MTPNCGCNVCLDQLLEADAPEELIIVNNQGSPSVFEVGVVNLPSGVSQIDVTFQAPKLSSEYTFRELSVENTSDASPLTIQANVLARSQFGFTAVLNGITDTANYKLRFEVEVVEIG